jgi:hypothetical protein
MSSIKACLDLIVSDKCRPSIAYLFNKLTANCFHFFSNCSNTLCLELEGSEGGRSNSVRWEIVGIGTVAAGDGGGGTEVVVKRKGLGRRHS